MEEEYIGWRESGQYDPDFAEAMRKKHLSNTLNTNQKMELYNCAVGGNLDTLINLIQDKKYPLFEECSASGYYWTVIHYAAHYGFENIINYVLEHLNNDSNKKSIANLQSNLGLTPLFINLNSSTAIEKKKTILELYVKHDAIDFKLCSKDNEDVYDIVKKNGLLMYFLSILKED